MRNHLVTSHHDLLDKNGHLIEPGWSTSLVQKYDRAAIKKRKTRIKEWDYYYVMSNSNEFALCLTVSDLSYLGMYSISFVDLKNAVEHTDSVIVPFTMGKTDLPPSSAAGDVKFKNKKIYCVIVGIGNPEHKELYEDAINKNFKSKEKENIIFYFLRGAIDFTKLKIHHALMMLMNRKILATKNIQTEDDKIFLENYGKKLDYLSKNSINDIVSDIKNYLKEL